MNILRKTYFDEKSKEIRCLWFCGPFKIIFGYFLCRCCYCKVSDDKNVSQELRVGETQWKNFITENVKTIAKEDLHSMKESYISCQYNHKFYCTRFFQKCCHNSLIKLGGLIQEPVLYLIVVDFEQLNRLNLSVEKSNDISHSDTLTDEIIKKANFLQIFLKNMLPQNIVVERAFNDIKDNLDRETNNICLVLENISYEYGENFQENYLRDAVLVLHQYYKVTLIYR